MYIDRIVYLYGMLHRFVSNFVGVLISFETYSHSRKSGFLRKSLNGPPHLFRNKGPIKGMSEVKYMKIRTLRVAGSFGGGSEGGLGVRVAVTFI